MMAEAVNDNGEIQPHLPAEFQFLHDADTSGITVWIFDNRFEWDVRGILPTVWHLLEKRIREHPHEAREENEGEHGDLPIISVFRSSMPVFRTSPFTPVPLSVVQLLIDTHPEGLCTQDGMNVFRYTLQWSIPTLNAFVQSFTAATRRQQ